MKITFEQSTPNKQIDLDLLGTELTISIHNNDLKQYEFIEISKEELKDLIGALLHIQSKTRK